MFHNRSASLKLASLLNKEHEAAQYLLHRLRVAASETAAEYGYLKLIEMMHRYGEPRKNQTSTPTQNDEHGRLLKRGKQNMGFWSNLRNSLHKSFELKRISRTLGQFDTPRTASNNFYDLERSFYAEMAAKDEIEKAEEALFDLIENDGMLSATIRRRGASRDDLRAIYRSLRPIAGEWHRGHWVPARALAFGQTLDYLLSEWFSLTRPPEQKSEDNIYYQWAAAGFKVLKYFEEGRVRHEYISTIEAAGFWLSRAALFDPSKAVSTTRAKFYPDAEASAPDQSALPCPIAANHRDSSES